MRSISAVLAPPQNVGGRWESPERLPSDISSWRRAHHCAAPTHHFTLGNRCLKLKALLFLLSVKIAYFAKFYCWDCMDFF